MENETEDKEVKLELIEEDERKYVVKNEEGEILNLYKIDLDEINRSHRESCEKVINALSLDEIEKLRDDLQHVVNRVPDVTEYFFVSKDITDTLNHLYEKVGSPNLFHHPIKEIDPDIYGKAHTFMHQVIMLLKTLHDILEIIENKK